MKSSADFRYIARKALSGKWLTAVLTALVASLIGARIATGGGSSSGNSEGEGISLENYFSAEVLDIFRLVLGFLFAYVVIACIVSFVIGGAGKLGYARFNLNLIDGKGARFRDLFSQFDRLGDGFLMNLLLGLYVFLWSLLFVIPGIIKSFSYAMTPYILSEHPEYESNEAITLSRKMMDGNKFRLFCLNLSFIGWSLLCAVPSSIAVIAMVLGHFLYLPLILLTFVGDLFVSAYAEAAQAAFYREISNTEIGFTVSYSDMSNKM